MSACNRPRSTLVNSLWKGGAGHIFHCRVELQLHPCDNRSALARQTEGPFRWCMISSSPWAKAGTTVTRQGSARHYIVGCEKPWNRGINSSATVPAILCLTFTHMFFFPRIVVLFLLVLLKWRLWNQLYILEIHQHRYMYVCMWNLLFNMEILLQPTSSPKFTKQIICPGGDTHAALRWAWRWIPTFVW